jgi:hypothetical protein
MTANALAYPARTQGAGMTSSGRSAPVCALKDAIGTGGFDDLRRLHRMPLDQREWESVEGSSGVLRSDPARTGCVPDDHGPGCLYPHRHDQEDG